MTFSIIIPVYNVAPYLRECLDSLLAQTFTDWEAICVDDGSTDGSGGMLDEYAAKDIRVRAFHQTNQGVSAARNFGLSRVCGSWIVFVDADDRMSPGYLMAYAREIEDGSDADVIGGAWVECESDGRTPISSDKNWDRQTISGDVLQGLLCSDSIRFTYCVCGKAFRTELIRLSGCRFPIGVVLGEDTTFNIMVFSYVKSFLILSTAERYFYRKHIGQSTTALPVWKRLQIVTRLDLLYKRYSQCESKGLRKMVLQTAWQCVQEMCKYSGAERSAYIRGLLDDRNFYAGVLPALKKCGRGWRVSFARAMELSPIFLRSVILHVFGIIRSMHYSIRGWTE